ncbi:TPA: restriction endonuclease subunit S [Salmonella enterica subsp. enterica serovar Newport]|nr:restriction endonuclease subunit S [Salmonella enterica subsp. diarizonae serovar 59:z10:-]
MRLGDVCIKIGSGATPRGGKDAYKIYGMPLIRSQNVLDFSFSKAGLAFIDSIQAKALDNVTVHDNDVLINITGDSVARVCMVPADYVPARVNQHVAIVRTNSQLADSHYILYHLQFLKSHLLSLASSGATRNALTKQMIENLEINLPPLSEQIEIGRTLRALDDKIANNTAINHHLEQIAQAIFKSWFVDLEPFGGVMPNDWQKGKLGDIIELFDFKRIPLSGNQRSKMAKIYPYYGAATLVDYVDDYIFDGVYLLLGEDGTVIDNLGFPILQYVWGKFWVNNHAHILQGRNGFTVESLYVLLKQANVMSIVTGAVQPKINQVNLKALNVLIPSAEVMKQYNALITPLFSKIRASHDENLHLAETRDVLLPKLMSGELSVADLGDAK